MFKHKAMLIKQFREKIINDNAELKKVADELEKQQKFQYKAVKAGRATTDHFGKFIHVP